MNLFKNAYLGLLYSFFTVAAITGAIVIAVGLGLIFKLGTITINSSF